MNGFEQLVSESGHGGAWVRLAHITAIRVLRIREGTGTEHNIVTVLAGGEWFRDPIDYESADAAQARAEVLAGRGPSRSWRARLRDAVSVITGP